MKKIQYNGSSKILNGIVTKVNLIIDKLVVDVKVNGTSVVVVNQEGEREADIDLSLADQNVKQSPTTSSDNSDYRVLLSKSANDTEETDISRKDTNLRYNPYSGELNTSKLRAANGYFYGLSVTELQTAQYYFINGSSQVVAMLEANSASQASNPTMLYLPSTTGTLATLADIPTVVDEKVKQTPENSSSSEFEVLLSGTADNTEHTEGAKKSSKLKFVPWNSSLEVGTLSNGFYNGSVEAGSIKGYGVSGIQLDAGDLSNKGTLSIFNNAGKAANVKFSNSATSDKSFEFPKVGGTIATLNDIPTITDTYDGTSPEGMSGIAVKSAIDALDVASTSIGAGETLATIKEENGKIAVTKQNIKINQGQVDNTCIVGTQSDISGSVTWHKFASTTITGANTDCIIMLAVNDTYVPDTASGSDSNGGILYCRVRQGNPVGTFSYAKMKFVSNTGLNADSFRLYYTLNSNSITFELWTSLTRQYSYRRFTIINQGQRTVTYANNAFTLHDSTAPSSPPTESTTCKRVDCEDNTYKQTDNNLLGSKNLLDATNLSRTNQTVTSTYNSDDGTITINGTARNNGGILENLQQIKIPNLKVGDEIILSLEVISGTFSHTASATTSFFLGKLSDGSSLDGKYAVLGSSLSAGDKISCVYEVKSDMIVDGVFTIRSCQIYMRQNDVFNNLKLAIMLRPKSVANDTYNMYSMTNSQLTVSKADYSQIADIEKATTASRAYAKNELMIWQGDLHRVTQAITSGGSITLNTNVVATTLSAEIKAIRDALNI